MGPLLNGLLLVLLLLVRGHSRKAGTRPVGATRPGDFIIGGVFPIHQDVQRDSAFFPPQMQKCVR